MNEQVQSDRTVGKPGALTPDSPPAVWDVGDLQCLGRIEIDLESTKADPFRKMTVVLFKYFIRNSMSDLATVKERTIYSP